MWAIRAKFFVTTRFEKFPKVQYIAQSGHLAAMAIEELMSLTNFGITTLIWYEALRLCVASHMTSFNQSE